MQDEYDSLRARLAERAESGTSSTSAASSTLMQAIELEPTERVSRIIVDRRQARLRDVSNVIRTVVSGREGPFHKDTARMSDRVERVSTELAALEQSRAWELYQLEEQATLSIEEYEAYLTETGLDLERVAARFKSALPSPAGGALGIGGPLVEFGDGADFGDVDLTYHDRQLLRIDGKLERLSSLEAALTSIPLAMPVSNKLRNSSRFGPRRDPFTKRGVHQSGLDFAGPYKASI